MSKRCRYGVQPRSQDGRHFIHTQVRTDVCLRVREVTHCATSSRPAAQCVTCCVIALVCRTFLPSIHSLFPPFTPIQPMARRGVPEIGVQSCWSLSRHESVVAVQLNGALVLL